MQVSINWRLCSILFYHWTVQSSPIQRPFSLKRKKLTMWCVASRYWNPLHWSAVLHQVYCNYTTVLFFISYQSHFEISAISSSARQTYLDPHVFSLLAAMVWCSTWIEWNRPVMKVKNQQPATQLFLFVQSDASSFQDAYVKSYATQNYLAYKMDKSSLTCNTLSNSKSCWRIIPRRQLQQKEGCVEQKHLLPENVYILIYFNRFNFALA